ncbi:hypothetical protein KIPB_004093, partial [Kipferlia bialata]
YSLSKRAMFSSRLLRATTARIYLIEL